MMTRMPTNNSTIRMLFSPSRVERRIEKVLRVSKWFTKNAMRQITASPSQRVTSQSMSGARLYMIRPVTPSTAPTMPIADIIRFIFAPSIISFSERVTKLPLHCVSHHSHFPTSP